MTEAIASYLRRNLHVFYAARVFNGLVFHAPVWVLFFTHYISFQQLAFLEALGLAVSVLLELPTGVLADIVGRKRAIIFGYLVSGFGYVLIGTGNSFTRFLIGYIVSSFGSAFASGADTAILFDTLKEHDVADDYPKYAGRTVFLFRLSVVGSMVAGQFLYAAFIGLPYIASGLAIMLCGSMYLFAREPTHEKRTLTPSSYVRGIKDGFREAFKDRPTRLLSMYFIVIASVEIMLLWFYYAPYVNWLGYGPQSIGIIYGAIAFGRMLVTLLSQRIDKLFGARNLIVILPIVLGLSLITGLVRNIYLGTAFLFASYALFTLRYTVLDKYTNLRFESKYRASALSSLNMFVSLIYAAVVWSLSRFITLSNVGIMLTIFGGVLLLVALPLGVLFIRTQQGKTVATSAAVATPNI